MSAVSETHYCAIFDYVSVHDGTFLQMAPYVYKVELSAQYRCRINNSGSEGKLSCRWELNEACNRYENHQITGGVRI